MPTKRTRITRTQYSILGELDGYRLLRVIFSDSIFRPDEGPGHGWADLRGLVTGEFPDADLCYCRSDDEDSQRHLWELFRTHILAARRRCAPGMKIWARRFDQKGKN